MTKIKKHCEWCGIGFLAKPKEVNRGRGKFCSIRCANTWKAKTILQTPEGWKIRKQRKRRGEFRFKDQAREAVSRAIKRGILVRMPCIVCGNINVQAHHPDHKKPLDVQWLCRQHHKH